jgi:hypothetical protein
LTGYTGLLPLMLAAVGVCASRHRLLAWFWLAAGLLAFVLTLGDATPVARLVYRLPVVSGFRVPARHFIETTFAISVLSGLGIAAIQRERTTRRAVLGAVFTGATLMALGLLVAHLSRLTEYADKKGISHLSLSPRTNSAIAIPLLAFLAASAGLIYWHKRPRSVFRSALLLTILTLDLASFGWFHDWSGYSPHKSILSPPPIASRYREVLSTTHQRVLSARGVRGSVNELPPNLSRLWGVPSVNGYGPLIISRVSQLLSLSGTGGVEQAWHNPSDQSLNIMGARYLLLPRGETMTDAHGINWAAEDMGLWLGSGCDKPQPDSVRFELSSSFRASKIGIVSRLACSSGTPEGEEVARILVSDDNGNVQAQSLLAGRDTSEWAYDCNVVKPHMQHRRAEVFKTFSASMYDEPCEGHMYVTELALGRAQNIKSVKIQWVGRSGALILEKVNLIDELTERTEPLDYAAASSDRWRLVENANGVRVYENSQARPRAWLVSEAINVRPEEALATIKSSRLPDGRSFDPSKTVLTEEPINLAPHAADNRASAQIIHLSGSMMEARTSSASSALLVTSDVYYPGWQATIDGAATRLFRVNYALRGVAVPPGEHVVRFVFRPRSFYYGAAISAISLLALGPLIFYSCVERHSSVVPVEPTNRSAAH